jgi:hypothetical protein
MLNISRLVLIKPCRPWTVVRIHFAFSSQTHRWSIGIIHQAESLVSIDSAALPSPARLIFPHNIMASDEVVGGYYIFILCGSANPN